MAIRYGAHARMRMRERGISEEDVAFVLQNPADFRDDPDKGSVRLTATVGGRVLKVWVVAPWPDGDRVFVKSTAWKDEEQWRN